MFVNKFKVCVSLATDSVDKLPTMIDSALRRGADYVEIRFDHTIYNDMDSALEISDKIKNRAIYTLRSKHERGFFEGDRSEQISLLRKMGNTKPMLLDIDFSVLKKDKDLTKFVRDNKIPILVSSHDFRNTPNKSLLLKKFEDMRKYSNYVKLVTTARNFEDNLKVLSLYDNNISTNLIAFAMGEHGISSRLLCTLYGNSPFTYASLDNPLAPGQLDIGIMKKIYDRIAKNLKNK